MDISELIISRNGETLLHMRIERAEVCIGSNPTNDVVMPEGDVPEAIAVMFDRGAGRFRVRDLTEGALLLNGAKFDGEEVDAKSGDVLGFGEYRMELQSRDTGRRTGKTTLLKTTRDNAPRATARVTYLGRELDLRADVPFNIGGHEDNDLVIDDQFISAFHARIANQNGRWFLSDLESTNGTRMNGLRIRETELPASAQIVVGKAAIDFSAGFDPTEEERDAFHGMIATSEEMHRVFALVRRFADASEPVLIGGESGSGKELIARALHDESKRADGPYLALNCGALNPTLVESELFGHEKAAFTGADSAKQGAFEATSGGTLFLDEIGELPLDLQPKLLRVLETRSVRPLGGTKEIPVDTRIVAATHRNLEELVEDGTFREDLFHRLFVLTLRVPPLVERPDDILPLARHFIASQSPRPLSLTSGAEEALRDYTWPGNVRELRNVLVRAILLTDADRIGPDDLQFSRDAFTTRARDVRRSVRQHDEAERNRMLEILDECRGNRAEAARMLGVSKSTFHDRLKRYGIGNKFGDRK